MAKLKLRVTKVKNKNLNSQKWGFIARVQTNGTADYEDIVEDAAEDTTFNVDEIRAAAGIFCRAAAKMLKQGYIVDLGPIGKLYPSCSSTWFEKEDDLKLSSVKPSLYYRAADEVESAIKGASLVWAKASDQEAEEAESPQTPEGGSGSDDQGGDNTGGDNGGGSDDNGSDNTGGSDDNGGSDTPTPGDGGGTSYE